MLILRRVVAVGTIGFSVGAAFAWYAEGFTEPLDYMMMFVFGVIFAVLIEIAYLALLALSPLTKPLRNSYWIPGYKHSKMGWISDVWDDQWPQPYTPDHTGRADLTIGPRGVNVAASDATPAEPSQFE